jgi:hypothetical protein
MTCIPNADFCQQLPPGEEKQYEQPRKVVGLKPRPALGHSNEVSIAAGVTTDGDANLSSRGHPNNVGAVAAASAQFEKAIAPRFAVGVSLKAQAENFSTKGERRSAPFGKDLTGQAQLNASVDVFSTTSESVRSRVYASGFVGVQGTYRTYDEAWAQGNASTMNAEPYAGAGLYAEALADTKFGRFSVYGGANITQALGKDAASNPTVGLQGGLCDEVKIPGTNQPVRFCAEGTISTPAEEKKGDLLDEASATGVGTITIPF